jgi:hypothetical protein
MPPAYRSCTLPCSLPFAKDPRALRSSIKMPSRLKLLIFEDAPGLQILKASPKSPLPNFPVPGFKNQPKDPCPTGHANI